MKNSMLRPIALLTTGLFWAGFAHAQSSVNGAGGDASGTGGSVAYSVGQVVYTTATGSTRSMAQGVQQPYEISVVTGLDKTTIQIGSSPSDADDMFGIPYINGTLFPTSYQTMRVASGVRYLTAGTTTQAKAAIQGGGFFAPPVNNTCFIQIVKLN